MKKKLLCTLLCTITVLLLTVTASADMGPKPSVRITLEGLGDELCYGTLLSEKKSTGPSSAWDGTESGARHNENEYYSYAELDYATWKAFAEYEDTDGYYFLQEGWRVDETKTLAWTYYPPQSFKLLLYFPESNTFAVSGIYEQYAFDSYFTVNMDGMSIGAVDPPLLVAEKSYDYTWELVSLAARIVLTILLEVGIALLLFYRAKKQLLLIAGVNVITQIVLNVLLNVINYNAGSLAFTAAYIFFELIVFAIEAVAFSILLPRCSKTPTKRWKTVLYALVANAASFAAGFAIAKMIPGIF